MVLVQSPKISKTTGEYKGTSGDHGLLRFALIQRRVLDTWGDSLH